MNEEEAKEEALKKNGSIDSAYIKNRLKTSTNFYRVYIDEYTHNGLRIDGLAIKLGDRTISGYEIKVSRSDFKQDKKWQLYGEFCSNLSIVCPPDLIHPEEIDKPFGLIWIGYEATKKRSWNKDDTEFEVTEMFTYKRKPKELADTNMFNWIFTYTKVLEYEFPRLVGEVNDLKMRLNSRPT